MRKWLVILIIGVFLVGCSNGDQEGKDNPSQGTPSETTGETSSKNKQSEQKNKKKTYQIGETAVVTSDLYDFDYEVTVTDFNLTKEVDGVNIEDYIISGHGDERFAVVDVTIKNISDESYVPNEMFSANFASEGDRGGITSEDEFFEVGDKELAPGEELEGHLVYVILLDDSETFTLKYEFMSDEETHFILPNPEK